MDKIIRDGVTLSARSTGALTSGRELLLIHGLNANMAFWHPILLRELGAGHRLIMSDQRGHGRSDMPAVGYTPIDLARDAAAVLDGYGVRTADIVAHSFGAAIALQVARLFPTRVRSLVLLDPRLRVFQPELKLADWPDFQRWKAMLGEAGEKLDPDLTLDFMLPLHFADAALRRSGPDLSASGFAVIGGGRRATARYRRLLAETTAPGDYQRLEGLDVPSLRALRCAVLTVYGSRSPLIDALTAVRRELPAWETRVLAQGRHNFPALFPEETAHCVLEFLEGRSAPGAQDHSLVEWAAQAAGVPNQPARDGEPS
jgi:pimeloyl-ACP methyl ester carboxylesterase